MALFKDNIGETLDVLGQLLQGIPPESRKRAQKAAVRLEQTFTQLRNDAPNDPATALGAAFGIFKIAERLIELDRDDTKKGKGLIQLL